MIDIWLEQRREGVEQDEAGIRGFVDGVLDGSVSPAQIGAWLAFVMTGGMTAAETVLLTKAMTDSGTTLAWPGIVGPFVDKHSTGGVGDKVSLILAPLWASLGKKVPMLSGRGLGITGGTLDKLEAIAGYRTDLSQQELHEVLADAGCFITGQTPDIAPADRILYATRNETGTVPSIPLITASILSKKLVAGLDSLVLDVKYGSGAFMKNKQDAQALAESLVEVGKGAGCDTSAVLTDMSQPLGHAVGNALEVEESIATLEGNGPEDLVDLVVQLSGLGEVAREQLQSGAALPYWQRLVKAQGGDLEQALRGAGCEQVEVKASATGVVKRCDAEGIGRAAFRLGAGRQRAEDSVHHGVGVRAVAKVGTTVQAGDVIAEVFHCGNGLDEALNLIERSYRIG
ncbi:MAG: thymidine phosphorylase [Planctomycetota bacterium]|nr:thymidine phosphorylase [Planctomycetota bacterium]